MQHPPHNRLATIPQHRDDGPDEHPATDQAGRDPTAAESDATTRKQGRPKGATSGKRKAEKQAAQLTTPGDRVPSMGCPHCGQAIWPRTLRGANKAGEIPCECPQCAHRFGYTPPQVRPL
jgi:DNA-directed RNA polymerase subunit M/transcription elongation factor TFIIS